jgi:enoyl-CoA hydratase/carnithine racemase
MVEEVRARCSRGLQPSNDVPTQEKGRRLAAELVHEYDTILLERDGTVATVILNRPDRLNAMYTKVFEEFSEAFALIRADPTVRAVVVTGAGRAFCAGGDIKLDVSQVRDWGPSATIYENEIAHRMIRDIRELPRPVIARVNAAAVTSRSPVTS